MKLSDLKYNPDNPFPKKSDEDFKTLVESIRQFPKMLKYRKIVYDPETMIVLGGNKRLLALKELKYKEIPDDFVISANDLTEDEKMRFVVADNVEFGTWDFDILNDKWAEYDVKSWGIVFPEQNFESDDDDSENELETDEITINLALSQLDYNKWKNLKSKEGIFSDLQLFLKIFKLYDKQL